VRAVVYSRDTFFSCSRTFCLISLGDGSSPTIFPFLNSGFIMASRAIPRGYLGWGHTSTLGFSIPAMMGAKLACPDRLCVAFLGDAAFGQQGMDIETSVREKLPIMMVVLNNGGFSGYEKHHPSTSKVSPSNVQNYSKVAEGLGAYSERIEKSDDLVPAFKRGIKSANAGRTALIECITTVFPRYPGFVHALDTSSLFFLSSFRLLSGFEGFY